VRRAGAPQSPVPPCHRRQAHGLEPRGPPRAWTPQYGPPRHPRHERAPRLAAPRV